METYFNLRKSFPFYGAYHREWRNILIHIVGVPSIAATLLNFLSHVKIPGTGDAVTVADALISTYGVSFLAMEPVAALLYMPVLAGIRHVGVNVLNSKMELAIALHVVAWIAQFVGHGVCEGRKPALLDSFFQSVHAAVFFVWLELLFFLGYRPELKKELDALTAKEAAKFDKVKK